MRNIAILGATKLANTSWRPGKKVCSFAFLGATELDFRQAELEEGVTKVKAIALLGANSIIVPKDIPVSLVRILVPGGQGVEVLRGETARRIIQQVAAGDRHKHPWCMRGLRRKRGRAEVLSITA